ncbi:hypothetical protein PPERSA_08293 [Pseudocohnilembus persalinus]|uniref:Nbr1 FW domain-containing protein n=1 Tax=Pseudocohnilembus persalinus TaxID=266149 RepID=A0A0V0QP65_PSEPJ|nr:hypothetical protein PPERSA_08293 [Pseudocohnilembus persalinus]|eukprot:KRX04078.1 hypothetical protein PPERSA_08293 [Pseudocohnilembus persalinus]
MQTLNSQIYFQENIQEQLENKENKILLRVNSNNNNKQNQNQILIQNEDPKKQNNNNKILKLEDLEQQAKVIKQSDQILKRIQPLQKYKLIVEIKNNGKESWPEETYIKCISGYKEGEKKKLGKLDSQDTIQVQFTDTAPADCEKHLISWRMFYKNINGEEDQFGPRIQYQIIVQDNTQIL